MNHEPAATCRVWEHFKERDRIGVWGFGNVSKDVVLSLVSEGLGKEIVFYGRPKEKFPNRAGAWVDDLKANTVRSPRIYGTNCLADMSELDVIFIGAGVPRKQGQTRRDLLETNTDVITHIALEIRGLYRNCPEKDLPVLVLMGNPVTTMTWIAWKATRFPRQNIMGQAGNLDSRRICHALSEMFGLSGNEMRGIVFGDHGDSMVASPHFFTVGGIPLDTFARVEKKNMDDLIRVIDNAKKGGTHFVSETGRSASAGPARAACDMLRCIVSGQSEVQPVVAIIDNEYSLLDSEDGLDSMGFGVPAKVGRNGVEEIYELPVDHLKQQLVESAANIKEDIRIAASILKEKFLIS